MGNPSLEQMITFLLDTPMFGDLDASELAQIVHIMQVRDLAAGEIVFEEKSPGDAWYVLFDGAVDVVKRTPDGETVVATLTKRACFGEMAILDGSPRSATVRATGPARAFRFPRTAFEQLLKSSTLAAYKLVHQMALVLVSRQRQTTAKLVELMAVEDPHALREGLQPLVARSSVAE